MPFSVTLALPNDIPELSTIQWAALLNNPLIQTLYPQGVTPALATFTKDSYIKALQYPSVRLIKAVDVESGEIVAFAKWILYSEQKEELIQLEEDEWVSGRAPKEGGWRHSGVPKRPDGVDEKALAAWNNVMTRTRKEIMRRRKHDCRNPGHCSLECYFASIAPALWVLDIIHTHPLHQGRGAASQLLTWGIDLANETALQCYVETSPVGYPLFSDRDFEDVAEMEIELNQFKEGHGEYRYKHIVMLRPPQRPPTVPPKDPQVLPKDEWDFNFGVVKSSSPDIVTPVRRISGKASLVDIKRSPGPGRRSTSSKQSDSWKSMTGKFPEPPNRHSSHLDHLQEPSSGKTVLGEDATISLFRRFSL